MKKDDYLSRFRQYGLERVFAFEYPDFVFVLVGYPIWRGYIVFKKLNFNLEVMPEINLKNRLISFPSDMDLYDDENRNVEQKFEVIDLSSDFISEKVERFFEMIPKEISDAVSVFKDSHWEIVKAIVQFGDQLLNLINTQPAIGYITVNMCKLNGTYNTSNNFDYVEKIILNKQREIVEIARLIGSQRIVKALAKLDLDLLTVENLIALRQGLSITREIRDRILEMISHEKKIEYGLFQLIGTHSYLLKIITNRAVREIVKSKQREEHIKKLIEVYKRFEAYQLKEPKFNSIQGMKNIDERIEKGLVKLRGYGINFPEPPIKGNEYIIPIETYVDLKYWGRKQMNCIGGYSDSIMRGKKYLYKVIYFGEEATLELKILKYGMKIGDFKGTRNGSTTRTLRVLVEDWLKSSEVNVNIEMSSFWSR
jgi:hypothetical protein